MKFLIKLISLSFLICSALYVFSGVVRATDRDEKSLNYLVVGFDSAPANTDVLCVASYDCEANTVRAVQIPRDSVIKYGDDYLKINAYYSKKVLEGATHQAALGALSGKISELLGIEIDGYLAVSQEGLVSFVDFLGGVYVSESDIPKELSGSFEVEDGKVFLDGDDAIEFVRYRKEYTRGDLDRLDAQKTFIKSLVARIGERRELFSILRFASENDGISFEANKGRSFSILLDNVFKISNADFQISTLPGEAKKHNGVWYYLVNREKSIALISGYFPHLRNEFDTKRDFIYNF